MNRSIASRRLPLMSLVLAATLLWFAVPRIGAAVVALPGEPTANLLNKGEIPSRETLEAFAANREEALTLTRDPVLAYQLSLAYWGLSRAVPKAQSLQYVQQARAASAGELSWRPMNGRSWWRLGYAAYRIDGEPTAQSRDALLMSAAVQPNGMTLLLSRLDYLVRHWALLAPAQKGSLKTQIVETWRRNPEGIVRFANRKKLHLAVIRASLATTPVDLAGFEAIYAHRRAEKGVR